MRTLRRTSLAAFCLGGLLCGCGQSAIGPDPMMPSIIRAPGSPDPGISARAIDLTIELSRDFMPISPPEGRPLLAIVIVESLDGAEPPTGLEAERLELRYGGQTWQTRLVALPAPASRPMWRAADGPLWPPGSSVAAQVDFRLAGRVFRTRVRDVVIRATY